MTINHLALWAIPTAVLFAAGIWAIASMSLPRSRTSRLHRWRAWESQRRVEAERVDVNRNEGHRFAFVSQFETPFLSRYRQFLQRSQSPYGPVMLPLLSLVFGALGLAIGFILLQNGPIGIALGVVLGVAPSLYLVRRKRQLKQQSELQFPQALDMITRNLRSGQALKVGLRMVGRDLPTPLGPEFAKTVEEVDFGLGMPQALERLSLRVDCSDLHFFVTAVKVQMETGGDLAEILDNTSQLIRERFKLKDEIKIKAGEAKLSAIILISLPIGLALYISLVNKAYISVLVTDPIGQIAAVIAVGLLLLGVITIRWMTHIKV